MDESLFLPVDQTANSAIEALPKQRSMRSEAWDRLKGNKTAMAGFWVLLVMVVLAIFAPFFSPYTYYETNLPLKNLSPCRTHLFGTDELGRDLFTRIWWGARISLFVGITASLIDLCIGVVYGACAGYLGKKTSEAMMRCADILSAIPYLLVVILLMVFMGSGILTILVALTMTGWIGMARIVRGQILTLKSSDYVKAAIACGSKPSRIMFRHLIPNCIAPIIVTVTFTVPTAIFAEAFLSFLGLGIQAPIASWGTMASDGLPALRYYPWRLFFPAGFISVTMLAFNLLGDGLRDAFDPRMRS